MLRVVSRTLDTLHLAILVIMLYHYTVTNWGDVVVLGLTTWCAAIEFSWKNLQVEQLSGVWKSKFWSEYAPALQLNTNHAHLRHSCGRRSLLWLYSASSLSVSGVVSVISLSLSPLEVRFVTQLSFPVSGKNWVLAGAIVGSLFNLSAAYGLLMVKSGDIITDSTRCLCLHTSFISVLMCKQWQGLVPQYAWCTCTHSFFLERPRLATDSRILQSFQESLSTTDSKGDKVGLYLYFKLFTYRDILKFRIETGLSSDIACDLVITASMVYYLQKSRTGFKGYMFRASAWCFLKFLTAWHLQHEPDD